MSPPEHPFPVTQLPSRVHTQLDAQGNLKTRKVLPEPSPSSNSTKPGFDFDMKRDCELMELVQYSCTPWQEAIGGRREECWPVVRLFRRCRERGGKVFHVETTAWEGAGAWKGTGIKEGKTYTGSSGNGRKSEEFPSTQPTPSSLFADYASYFWSGKS